MTIDATLAKVDQARRKPRKVSERPVPREGVTLADFHMYMPTHQPLFVPTRELWTTAAVNGRVPWPLGPSGARISPSAWLDANKPLEQMVWHPAEPELIRDKVMQSAGWIAHPGVTVFNAYRPPVAPRGDAGKVGPWFDHVFTVYPDDGWHIIRWLAHRVQRPGHKCNHALVLGGRQGIGKDTILEPVKLAIGPWNWSDISPGQMLGRFNGWVKAVVVRINEARDLGEVDRFGFYDHSKTIIAAPPDVLRVDEKHLREVYVANVAGVIITTNHLADGLYLPADDRRHYVAWSQKTREDFDEGYWRQLYGWFASGGTGHVGEYLRTFDLTDFDPKAPPMKTPAFWQIVAASESPESGELRDVIDKLDNPPALTLQMLVQRAQDERMHGLADELLDRKQRRAMPHKMERIGYVPVRNPDADDGLFLVRGKRQSVYAQRSLTLADQVRSARRLS